MRTKRKFQNIILLIISFLFCCYYSQGQELIGKIKINEKYKNITNLSGSLNDSISFHIVINKIRKTRNYESQLYFFNENKQTRVINLLKQNEKPIYLAFHTNDNILTLIRKSEKGTVIKDINYLTGEATSKTISLKPSKIFSHKNITFIMDKKYDDSYDGSHGSSNSSSLDYAFVKNSKSIKRNVLSYKNETIIQTFLDNSTFNSEFINDLQYIENGPIKKFKGFYNNKKLTFVNDDKRKGEINIIHIESTGEVNTKKIIVQKKDRLKKMNSFIKDTFLFNFSMSKTLAFLNIYDLQTNKLIKSFPYNAEIFGMYNNVVINGKKSNDSFNRKRFYKSFFPQAIGSMYNAELYVAINKSDKNSYIVRIGHLDKNSYNNQSSGNFWWNYPAFSLNYNLNSSTFSGGFNPASASLLVFNALAENKRKGNFFELNLDSDFNQIKEEQSFLHPFFNENKYNNKIKNLMTLKKHFYIPLKKNIRIINFKPEDNSYYLYDLPKIK